MWSVIVKKKNVWKQSKTSSSPAPAVNSESVPPPQVFRSARELAFFLIEEYRLNHQFVSDSLQRWDRRIDLSPKDRRLAVEISIGVIRRQLTLDRLIESQLSRPREKVEVPLWTLLQTGIYQLVILDQIPVHAAVSETVELAGRLKRVRWKKMVNAILRSIHRVMDEELDTTPQPNTLPLGPARFRRFKADLFEDPVQNPAGYLSQAFSFPEVLVSDWLKQFGWDQTVSIAQWFNQRNLLTLRVNLLKTTRDELLEEFKQAGIPASAGEERQIIRLEEFVPLEKLVGFDTGKFTIQDESAVAAGNLLNPQPGETVWDLCAAPGTKTTLLAELMSDRGTVIATDISDDRLEKIEQNASRLGLKSIQTHLTDPQSPFVPEASVDAILVDAPCSNSGVLGKRPEARWRIDDAAVAELIEIQKQLLRLALDHLKPAGRLVYSTCSFDPRENQHLLRAVLEEYPEWDIVCEKVHIPGAPADGGYQAFVQSTRK